MKTTLQKFTGAVCLLLLCSQAIALDSSKAIIFGVVPQQTTAKLIKSWGPVMTYLRNEIKRPVRLATAPTISEFEQRIQRGEYDIAYMNPYHYITYAKNPGYRVIANQSDKMLHGIIVVPKGSNYQSWQDLNGLTLHLPSPNAFASSLLVQAELRRQNIVFKTHYAGSHDSVYRNVAMNIAHAGGGISRTFKVQPSKLSERLRIMGITQGYTSHAIAVHPRLEKPLYELIQKALLKLPKPILEALHFNPLQIASDKDYDDIRDLNIDKSLN